LDDIQLTISQVFLILNLNGVVFFLYASAAWTEADDTLYNLTDVWNQVLFITLFLFWSEADMTFTSDAP